VSAVTRNLRSNSSYKCSGGLGITTPSPTSVVLGFTYPFASTHSLSSSLSSPPSLPAVHTTPSPSLHLFRAKDSAARLRGPVTRTSNPMLAATYKSGSTKVACSTSSGQKLASGRLERDFVMLESIGKGGFSQVWKVKEKSSGKLLAVKAGKPYTGVKNRYVMSHPLYSPILISVTMPAFVSSKNCLYYGTYP
jgi:mitosis inhibitor protein kinase SWE1